MSKIIIKYNNNKILKRNGDDLLAYDGTPISNFNASGSTQSQITITKGTSLNFYDLSLKNPTSWFWNFGTGLPATSTVKNPTGITYSLTGKSDVILLASNQFGYDQEYKVDYINVISSGKKFAVNFNADPTETQTNKYPTLTWTPEGSSQRIWVWNFFSGSTNGQSMSLKYTDGTSSNYTVTLPSTWADGYSNGAITGDDSGIYPDNVIRYNLVNYSYPVTSYSVRLTGLNTNLTYKCTMMGNRETWASTTRYTISGGTNKDGTYVTLSTNSNTQNTVSVSGIAPSSGGIIDILYKEESSGSHFAALEVDEE